MADLQKPRIHRLCPLVLVVWAFVFSGSNSAQDLTQIGRKNKPGLSGSFSLQGGPYFYSGDGTPRNQPFYWNSTGSITLSIWGWQAPFSYSVGSQERGYTQPFNRYGASPYYKWVKVHLGYRTMRFNPYTFAGLQFFGAGIDLEPKGFRFGAFYGRFNKPIAQDTLGAIVPIPAYRRMGMGVKIGAGSRRNFIDLMFFRAEDDASSIPNVAPGTRVAPMENVAIGLSTRIGIGEHLSWEMDLGSSLITNDTRSPELDTSNVPDFVTTMFRPRLASRALFAGNTSLRWTSRRFSIRAQYKEVEPGYRSLGAFYQQTDLRAITIEPSLNIRKNTIRVSGSIGLQEDNIRSTKITQSVRRIGSARVSWNPTRAYGIDASFSNYGMAQEAGLRVLNDTFRVAQVNRMYMISQRLSLINKERTWTATLTGGLQQLKDLNPFGTFNTSNNDVLYANFYIGRIRNRDNLSVNGGVNFNQNNTVNGTFMLLGPTLGFSKPFLSTKLTASISASFNKAFQGGSDAGTTINGSSSFQYRLSKAHRLQLTMTALQNKTTFVASREFTEVRFMAGYTFTFQTKP